MRRHKMFPSSAFLSDVHYHFRPSCPALHNIIMNRNQSTCEASENLLGPEAEEDIYEPTHRHGSQSYALVVTWTVVNIVIFLASASIWVSSLRQHDSIPQFEEAGDMLDAVRSHAIEYEVQSYSRPLEYDEIAGKAVLLDHGNQKFVGRPSLKIDAA